MLTQELRPGMVVLGLTPSPTAEVVAGVPEEIRERQGGYTWTTGYLVPVLVGEPIPVAGVDTQVEVVDQLDAKEAQAAADRAAAIMCSLDGSIRLDA